VYDADSQIFCRLIFGGIWVLRVRTCGASYCCATSATQLLWNMPTIHFQSDMLKLINSGDFNHNTPLHLAAESGNEECVVVLLAHESTIVNPRNISRRTPMHAAAENGHVRLAIKYHFLSRFNN